MLNNPAATFESTLFHYGYLEDGIILARGTAQKMADISKGTTIRLLENGRGQGQLARIVSIRLEDDSPADPSKGRVIATCSPVQDSSKPYKPKNMEYK